MQTDALVRYICNLMSYRFGVFFQDLGVLAHAYLQICCLPTNRGIKSRILICEKKIRLIKFDKHGNSLYLLAKRRVSMKMETFGPDDTCWLLGIELERCSTTEA